LPAYIVQASSRRYGSPTVLTRQCATLSVRASPPCAACVMLASNFPAFCSGTVITIIARHGPRCIAAGCLVFALPRMRIISLLEDCIATVDAAKERRDRLTVQIEKRLADWTLAPVVEALQALRGMAMVAAATIVAELGDISRFSKAEQLMSYLGLVPSEHSSGKRRRQGGITKAGNGAARRMLVEAAWSYRFPARISREQLLRQEQLAAPIRAIAWKAQERLCLQYRKLSRAGKPITTVTTAIARQLAGFVWAIAHEVGMPKA